MGGEGSGRLPNPETIAKRMEGMYEPKFFLPAGGIGGVKPEAKRSSSDVLLKSGDNVSLLVNDVPYLTSLGSETDPIWMSMSGNYYLASNPSGYISSYTETDPVFLSLSGNTAIPNNTIIFVSGNKYYGQANLLSFSGNNVGIGTTNPTQPLTIWTNQDAQAGLELINTNTGTGKSTRMDIYTDAAQTGPYYTIAVYPTNFYVASAAGWVKFSATNATGLQINGNGPLVLNNLGGNVGINKITPNFTLDVSGNINASGTISGNSYVNLPAETDPVYLALSGNSLITLATEQASTSGTSIDFTGIPAGVKRITIMFTGVSTNGTQPIGVQIGDAGGFETTGYLASAADPVSTSSSASKFLLTTSVTAARNYQGSFVLNLKNSSSFSWVGAGIIAADASNAFFSAGSKSLSAELTQVRITTDNGLDTFDAGTINISYEF